MRRTLAAMTDVQAPSDADMNADIKLITDSADRVFSWEQSLTFG